MPMHSIMAMRPHHATPTPRLRVAAELRQVMDTAAPIFAFAATDPAITRPDRATLITRVTLTPRRNRPSDTKARMGTASASDTDRAAPESQHEARFGKAWAPAPHSAQRALRANATPCTPRAA